MAIFLFDLDMTLVDSSALEDLRQNKIWSEVRKNLRLVRAFQPQPANGIAPHELPGRLQKAGHRVGVVTSSPRWYAEAILADFKISPDVLVAWDDTEAHKPDPAPLFKAMKELGVVPGPDVFYVGDDPVDVQAAYHASVTSIGVRWGETGAYSLSSTAPDIFIRRATRILEPETFSKLRYVGEAILDGGTVTPHWGSILRSNEIPRVYALGRYFTASDPRHSKSALSSAILSLKKDDSQAKQFGVALAAALSTRRWKPRYVVPVPPKPSQQRNRFSAVLKAAKPLLPTGFQIEEKGLKVVKEITDYKKMGIAERSDAISGAFESRFDWSKSRVLLIDDVYTTGETVRDCVRALQKDGAGEVRTFVFGKDQRTFERKVCPACSRPMKIRVNSRTQAKFWGCSGYPDSCRETVDIE
jgi:HAD superfamily hydrolase (TIGR01549 family)